MRLFPGSQRAQETQRGVSCFLYHLHVYRAGLVERPRPQRRILLSGRTTGGPREPGHDALLSLVPVLYD
jgi:hypothetical protein